MEMYREISDTTAIAVAERALARSSGRTVKVSLVQKLSDDRRRNLILRATAAWDDGSETPLIIKATRSAFYDPGSPAIFENSGLVKEWVATALLAQRKAAKSYTSEFLAGDVSAGLIVLREVGANPSSLVDALVGDDALKAENALMGYAAALGKLHAATIGCQREYVETLRSVFPAARLKSQWTEGAIADSAQTIRALMGGEIDGNDLAEIGQTVAEPGPWCALIHGDGCPDNVLFSQNEACLIDFEASTPGHALCDAAYWWMGFPTCWCAGRLPVDVARKVEREYLAQIAAAVPESLDQSSYRRELSLVCAAWSLQRVAKHLEFTLSKDEQWGLASRRSRVLWWLDAASAVMAESGALPSLRNIFEHWSRSLHKLWPSTRELGLFPAFEPPQPSHSNPWARTAPAGGRDDHEN